MVGLKDACSILIEKGPLSTPLGTKLPPNRWWLNLIAQRRIIVKIDSFSPILIRPRLETGKYFLLGQLGPLVEMTGKGKVNFQRCLVE